ncbi:MAG: GNAT family N-acetyltransferase, partial [Chloroflexota bacterium]|nr:GNAT family N-acetyltransferase [Chloroflexota bacterium]
MSAVRRRLRVVSFNGEHVEPAARLLADRHRRDREQTPALPAAFEDDGATLPSLRQSFQSDGTSGVAAFLGDELVGFLIGQRIAFPPDSTIAPYYRPTSALVRYDAHAAIADGAWDIYRELYSVAAEQWGEAGLTAHYIQLPATGNAVIDAWASLGFGRDLGWGLRDTSPMELPQPLPELTIRRATPADLDVVFQLDSALVQHEANSPVFMPYPTPIAEQEWRADLRDSLRDPTVRYWLAELDGQPAGLLNVNPPPPHISPLLTPEGMLNIFAASVLPGLRGGGIGGALLRHALDAARAEGHGWCR